MRRGVAIGGWLATALAVGCSGTTTAFDATDSALDANVDDAPVPDSDDAGVDVTFPPADWRCLGNSTSATPATSTVLLTVYTYPFRSNTTTLPGVTATACGADDIDCTHPLGLQTTGTLGSARFELPTGLGGFDGYLVLSKSGYRTSLAFYSPIIVENTRRTPLLADVIYELIYAAAQIALDPARGAIGVNVLDCTPRGNVGGVSLELEPDDGRARAVYFNGAMVDPALTHTLDGNVAGILDVAPGVYTVRARRADDGVVTSVRRVIVRANSATLADMDVNQ